MNATHPNIDRLSPSSHWRLQPTSRPVPTSSSPMPSSPWPPSAHCLPPPAHWFPPSAHWFPPPAHWPLPFLRPWLLLLLPLLAISCRGNNKPDTLFTRLDPEISGIHFNNKITENDSVNLIADEYAYMGSGVGVGDFNNDGLPDLFFGGSQTTCRLYLNLGNHHFRDITKTTGLETAGWCTGISIVDINNDGYPDIYVCVSGNVPGDKRKNLLFINNHDLTFKECAAEYGLADTGYSTQAAFFDYDHDGLLDMYLVEQELHPSVSQNDIVKPDTSGHSIRSDKLYKNMGILPGTNHPYFKDVSLAAGIKDDGYGLGVVVSDFNGDGWPDIYVTNDYLSNDLLWINNGDGTFTNSIAESLGHQSYSSMGVDAADINNDGLPDIATLDMMPEDNYRKKMMYSFMTYERYETERRAGYQPEFMRNMLQLNRGALQTPAPARTGPTPSFEPPTPAPPIPYFSEIGQLAGISQTDWSWSILLADFDNDGYKDISITNGIGRDLINADFVNYRAETYGRIDKETRDLLLRGQLDSMGKIALRKYYFRNNRDGSFSNESQLSGINEKAISNGAVYVDLDNDGDLDLVVNNINQEASIYINNTRQPNPSAPGSSPSPREPGPSPREPGISLREPGISPRNPNAANHYVNFILRGDSLNRDGFGAKIILWQKDLQQTVEQNPVRGYASSVDPRLHFGLGNSGNPDSVTIIWPNGKKQHLQHIPIDTTLTLKESDATLETPNQRKPITTPPALPPIRDRNSRRSPSFADLAGPRPSPSIVVLASPRTPRSSPLLAGPRAPRPSPSFTDITDSLRVKFKHQETFFNDFAFNSLLPQKYSQLGPFISTGDVNGDGLTDFFIGGAYNQSGEIWLQQKNGRFLGKKLVAGPKHEEDMQSILVDVDGDHDLDLIVVGGSSEFDKGSRFLTPRLYLNDGQGNFTLSPSAFPPSINTIAQTISFTGGIQAPANADSPDATSAAQRAARQVAPRAPDQATHRPPAPLRVFIGGRVSLDYPYSPKSYLLEYRGGVFVDITREVCPALSEPGMVTSSVWADLDGDGQDELIITGDWMPIRIFKSDHRQLKELTDSAGLSNDYGMWKSLAVADVDGDGDLDIIAGNLGANNPYHVSAETPLRLLAKDFQGNGRIDPLLCYYIPDETGKKTLQLGMNLNQLARQIPSFKTRFKTNVDFARANLAELLPDEMRKDAITLNCTELHTCWFENIGNGKFRKHVLPVEAQFAPVNAILARDLDGDGKLDLVLAGNEYQSDVVTGRYDASYGLFLRGQGHGNFKPINNIAQGIFIKGDVKDLRCIKNAKGDNLILAAINNESMKIFTHR